MKHVKTWIVLGIFAAVVAVVCSFSIRNMEAEQQARRDKIEGLKNEIAVLNNTREQNRVRLQLESAGVNNERMERDRKRVSDFMSCMLDWSSYMQYMEQRMRMRDEYGLSEDNYILSTLMPYVTSTTTNDGTVYNPIDGRDGQPGIESMCTDVELHCVRIQDRHYTYAVVATWQVSSKEQPGTGEEELVLLMTVDEDGGLHDIQTIF